MRVGPSLIPGAVVCGNRGLGVLGSTILADTATGDHGAGFLYNDVDPGDESKAFRGLITRLPTNGTLWANENGSFTYIGASDSFDVRLYVDGVDLGTETVSITIGASLVQPASDTTLGAWTSSTGGTLASCIDEAAPEDTDFISVGSASTCEMVLAEAAFPGGANQVLKYRASSTSASTLTVTLKQGSTTIMTRTHTLSGTITEYSDTLTSGEIAAITAGPISVTLGCS